MTKAIWRRHARCVNEHRAAHDAAVGRPLCVVGERQQNVQLGRRRRHALPRGTAIVKALQNAVKSGLKRQLLVVPRRAEVRNGRFQRRTRVAYEAFARTDFTPLRRGIIL